MERRYWKKAMYSWLGLVAQNHFIRRGGVPGWMLSSIVTLLTGVVISLEGTNLSGFFVKLETDSLGDEPERKWPPPIREAAILELRFQLLIGPTELNTGTPCAV